VGTLQLMSVAVERAGEAEVDSGASWVVMCS